MGFFARLFRRECAQAQTENAPADPNPKSADFCQRYEEMKWKLAASVFSGNEPGELAYFAGAGVLLEQLAAAEQLVRTDVVQTVTFRAQLDSPWVWGYVFGASAFLIEKYGFARDSPEANALIQQLHEEVHGPMPFSEVAQRSGRAAQDPQFPEGMHWGGSDAEAFLAGVNMQRRSRLAAYLVGGAQGSRA
jgi:hypothetical protein